MERFGEKLRTLRKRQGISLRKLATDLEFSSHAHLGRIETGEKRPSAVLILKITRYFNVSTDQLMKDEFELD
ncbi:MAG: XRE family transcriptional regulator [Anaerolineales bacterium]|nr:MAG: XRE family transcriptional regulator [Anaerolineales bacterium]